MAKKKDEPFARVLEDLLALDPDELAIVILGGLEYLHPLPGSGIQWKVKGGRSGRDRRRERMAAQLVAVGMPASAVGTGGFVERALDELDRIEMEADAYFEIDLLTEPEEDNDV
jgi:hypothetical protein